jgi:hypothetical protein
MNPTGHHHGGGPAFPTDSEAQVGNTTWHYTGMTLRDYFAAKALQGLVVEAVRCGNQIVAGSNLEGGDALCAARCYAMADAMLKARQA